MNCLLVEKTDDDGCEMHLREQPVPELKDGEVLIEVISSSLNYKDALAAQGHSGIVRQFPHVPGIDAVGTVLESRYSASPTEPSIAVGDVVIATGHEVGVEQWGGWSTHLVTRGEWLVALPADLSAEDAMTIGTAGFTAAQCVMAIQDAGVVPDDGPVIVSGATGGVGSLAVMLLASLGYKVVASTGKEDRHEWLKSLGADEVLGREALQSDSGKPLLKAQYAAGVDTVGGETLANMLKQVRHRGCVACCGMAGGTELPTTVYPFILRGVTLNGIDSAWCPDSLRRTLWNRLATDWQLPELAQVRQNLTFETVPDAVTDMLKGAFFGRGVVDIAGSASRQE